MPWSARRGDSLAVALALAVVLLVCLPVGGIVTGNALPAASISRLLSAPPTSSTTQSSPRSEQLSSGLLSGAGSVVESILPNYNASLPGNFPFRLDDWKVGTPAYVPSTDTFWLPELPVSTAGSPPPPTAPAVIFNATNGTIAGVVPLLSNLSSLLFVPSNGLLYGTNPQNDSVVSFNPSSFKLIGSAIRVGSNPSAMAFDPSTNLLFVANTGSGNVSVINTTTNQVYGSGINVSGAPVQLVDVKAAHLVFVASENASELSIINAAQIAAPPSTVPLLAAATSIAYSSKSGFVAATLGGGSPFLAMVNASTHATLTVDVGPWAHSVIVSLNETDFILANGTGGKLEIINATAPIPTVSSTVSLSQNSTWLELDEANDLAASWSSINRTLTEVNLPTNSVLRTSERLGPHPTTVVVDSSTGFGWFSSMASPWISSFDYSSGRSDSVTFRTGGNVQGLALAPSSNDLLVGMAGAVKEFNGLTGTLITQNMTLAGNNTALFSDPSDGVLWELNSNSGLIGLNLSTLKLQVGTSLSVLAGSPDAITLDASAHELFVVDAESSSVYEVDSSTGAIPNPPIPAGINATCAAFDPADDIVYVAGANLTLIDAATFQVVATLPIAPHHAAGGIAYDPSRQSIDVATDGPRLYSPGELSLVDGSSLPASESGFVTTALGLTPTQVTVGWPAGSDLPGSAVLFIPNLRSGTLSVVASRPIITEFSVTPSAVDVDQQAQLVITASGGAGPSTIVYSGLPPGCTSASSLELNCTPETSGTYTVAATVTDSLGFTATAWVNLTVATGLSVQALIANPSSGVADVLHPVEFEAAVTGGTAPINLTWSFGDGGVGYGPLVYHLYSETGSIPVTLVATDAAHATAVSSVVVDVVRLPQLTVAILGSNVTDVRVPRTFTATIQGGTTPGTGEWTFGDGTNASGSEVNHSWSRPGSFNVTYSYFDASGVGVRRSLPVLVNPTLEANLTISVGPAGTSLDFTASVSGGTPPYRVVWGFGDGSGGSGLVTNHSYAVAGNYVVTANVTDAAGALINATQPITVAAAPSGSSSSNAIEAGMTLGLIVGATAAAVVLFVAGAGRRRPPRHPPSPYVPPAESPPPTWKE